jgi:hypothetical protein
MAAPLSTGRNFVPTGLLREGTALGEGPCTSVLFRTSLLCHPFHQGSEPLMAAMAAEGL